MVVGAILGLVLVGEAPGRDCDDSGSKFTKFSVVTTLSVVGFSVEQKTTRIATWVYIKILRKK